MTNQATGSGRTFTPSTDSNTTPSKARVIGGIVKGILARAFIHFVIFFGSLILYAGDPQQTENALLMYLGLICIFSRNFSLSWRWWYPAFAGGFVAALFFFWLAIPLHFALLWGGGLSWLMVMVIKRRYLNTWEGFFCSLGDLVAGMFIIAAPIGTFHQVPQGALATWKAFAAFAWAVFFLSNIKWFENREPQEASALPPAEDASPAVAGGKLSLRMLGHGRAARPVRSTTTTSGSSLKRGAGRTAASASGKAGNAPQYAASAVPPIAPDSFAPDDFYGIMRAIRACHASYPEGIRDSLLSIADSTENILQRMAADPREVEYGARFLRHFLPAALNLADKHARLAAQRFSSREEMALALTRSEAMLSRLENAFTTKHYKLLKNDIADLSIEVDTLDSMLKMKGL